MEDFKRLCTNVAQSRYLVQSGVDPSTADMTWSKCRFTPKSAYGEDGYMLFAHPDMKTSHDMEGLPAWSASALMALLPHTIPNKYNREKDCVLFVGKDANDEFVASYDTDDESRVPTYVKGAVLVDVLFKLYCKVTGIFKDDLDDN